jgi:hypothetical protein
MLWLKGGRIELQKPSPVTVANVKKKKKKKKKKLPKETPSGSPRLPF